MWQLTLRSIVIQGECVAKELTVTRFPSVLGRQSTCDSRINSPFISRRHCAFTLKEGEVWVADLGSRNGTKLNGETLVNEHVLKDGDMLDLVDYQFQVHLTTGDLGKDEPEQARTKPRQRVLIVEDDTDAAETLAVMLHRWGHEVQVAHDGLEAIEAAQAYRPDAVLVDIRLPGMDGYEVAERLRRQPGPEPALIVAITGEAVDSEWPGGGSEFDRLLTKPVDPKVLQEIFHL
jgi:CheY-like chemotaxis protein